MSGTTTNFAFPYPGESDTPDGAAQIQSLATAVDTNLAVRDAAGRLSTIVTSTSSVTNGWASARALCFRVQACGGAGGGSPTTSGTQSTGGGGGGAGGYVEVTVPLSAITFPITVTIGAAGTGVSGAAGNSGGAVTVVDAASTVIASCTGGGGGQTLGNASGAPSINNGGSGGAATGTLAQVKVPGSPGILTSKSILGFAVPGQGGASPLGQAGAANAAGSGGAGTAGAGFGAGGGGGWSPISGAANAGGNGAPGVVIISPIY